MDISASMVKDLREKTGAGMMDCKKALVETNGDMDKAIDYLREKGISKAAKKAERIAAEGLSNIYINGNDAVVVELNSETDFVAKNSEFKDLLDKIGNTILENKVESMEDATFSKEDTPLEKPFELKSSTFSSEFTTLVYMLGDLEFSGLDSETFKKYRALEDKTLQKAGKKNLLTLNQSYKKCYDSLIKRYHNILRTIVGKDDKLVSMGQDLLGTLRLFNINGGYASFKAKHKDGKIGSEAISKEMYKEGIDRIKTLLNAINTYGTRVIERNGGIIIVNDTEKTREQRIAEINTKYFEIYDMILQARKQTVVSNL